MNKIIIFVLIGAGMLISTIATIPPADASCPEGHTGPCFDSFMTFTDRPITQEDILIYISKTLDPNIDNWQFPAEREWSSPFTTLEPPMIICTQFERNGSTEYRMMKWNEEGFISDLEKYRDDSMCDVWLPAAFETKEVTTHKRTHIATPLILPDEKIPKPIINILPGTILILFAVAMVPIFAYLSYPTKKK